MLTPGGGLALFLSLNFERKDILYYLNKKSPYWAEKTIISLSREKIKQNFIKKMLEFSGLEFAQVCRNQFQAARQCLNPKKACLKCLFKYIYTNVHHQLHQNFLWLRKGVLYYCDKLFRFLKPIELDQTCYFVQL
jgi:hypothetical protein